MIWLLKHQANSLSDWLWFLEKIHLLIEAIAGQKESRIYASVSKHRCYPFSLSLASISRNYKSRIRFCGQFLQENLVQYNKDPASQSWEFLNAHLGWKSRPDTQSLWPSPVMMRSPAGNPHMRHVPSSEAVTTTGFLGWIMTLWA